MDDVLLRKEVSATTNGTALFKSMVLNSVTANNFLFFIYDFSPLFYTYLNNDG
ncbi:hypothetical protein ISR2_0973 [Streptococcus pyogenes]|nr:hypothetical protein ISR2_0973 [Streptococcus pyogenes]